MSQVVTPACSYLSPTVQIKVTPARQPPLPTLLRVCWGIIKSTTSATLCTIGKQDPSIYPPGIRTLSSTLSTQNSVQTEQQSPTWEVHHNTANFISRSCGQLTTRLSIVDITNPFTKGQTRWKLFSCHECKTTKRFATDEMHITGQTKVLYIRTVISKSHQSL